MKSALFGILVVGLTIVAALLLVGCSSHPIAPSALSAFAPASVVPVTVASVPLPQPVATPEPEPAPAPTLPPIVEPAPSVAVPAPVPAVPHPPTVPSPVGPNSPCGLIPCPPPPAEGACGAVPCIPGTVAPVPPGLGDVPAQPVPGTTPPPPRVP